MGQARQGRRTKAKGLDEARRLLPLKPEVFHILLVLVEGGRHGYAIMQAVAERTAGEVRILPGALYRHLDRLRHEGVIEETASSDDTRCRSYRVTAFGKLVAEAEAARLARLVEAAVGQNLVRRWVR
ncbi:MAG: PadR family transcriptional regulator [Gemmatimonadetes bacterium]|nr:PadR family transcriptional regulator [Gemmatimonadota bacterium]